MKKVIALLLVVVIAASALSITAFAKTGFYNGHYYVANVTLSGTHVYGGFNVAGGGLVSCKVGGYVKNKHYGPGKWYWVNGDMQYSDNGSTAGSIEFNGRSLEVQMGRMWYAYKALTGYVYDY